MVETELKTLKGAHSLYVLSRLRSNNNFRMLLRIFDESVVMFMFASRLSLGESEG